MTCMTARAVEYSVMIDDVRYQQMRCWLDRCQNDLFGAESRMDTGSEHLTPASSDASFRRYFRWQNATASLIVMDAPPPRENCRPFVHVAGLLNSAGVRSPRILAADVEKGFLLLEDLGLQTYLDVLDAENADALFEAAIESLLAMQRLPLGDDLPSYDEALLSRELELFPEWYVKHHLKRDWDDASRARWQRLCRILIDNALAQPKVFVHRDFMPRNLMVGNPEPGVLDFQDAVYGPITYDITCLFKDAFISWPLAKVDDWLKRYWQKALDRGLPVHAQWTDFLAASDLMGIQRHLKVIGIFSRIFYRDGKPRYLTDVPRFFRYIDDVMARHEALTEFRGWLHELSDKDVSMV